MNAISWEEFVKTIVTLYAQPIREKRTAVKMRKTLDMLAKLGASSTADLTPELVAKFISTRPPEMSPRTVQGYLLYIQAACNLIEPMGILPVNPFKVRRMRQWIRVGRPPEQPHQTREEIQAIFEVLESDVSTRLGYAQWKARRLQALFAVFAYCGLRRNEALYLQVGDVFLEDRFLLVVSRAENRLKTDSSEAPVPIAAGLVPILSTWLEHRLDPPPVRKPRGPYSRENCPWLFPSLDMGSPWAGGNPGSRALGALQVVARRAGVQNVTFHSLRRSLATHLESEGLGQAMITRILRHSGEAITRKWYQKSDIPNLVESVKHLEF